VKGCEAPTLLGPLEAANLCHCIAINAVRYVQRSHQSRCRPLFRMRTETDPVSETLCSLEYRTMDKPLELSNPDYYTPSSKHFRMEQNGGHSKCMSCFRFSGLDTNADWMRNCVWIYPHVLNTSSI
jgi:hypothetical protein